MALLAHQKLTWVLSGQPFGTYADGDYSSATAPTLTKDSCSGTATSTTLTTTGSTFANGDVLKVIQMRGTGVGQWEIVKVASGGGSTSLTLSKALVYTYTDSGASQAQAVKIPMYKDVTVQAGTWSAPAWDGNVGGVLTFACKSLTPTGTISASEKGFRSFVTVPTYGDGWDGVNAEGSAGVGNVVSKSANGSGGGGGDGNSTTGGGDRGASGGGGGNGEVGANGENAGSEVGGTGGSATGNTYLTNMTLGGGGGQCGFDNTDDVGSRGGYGAGIITIFVKEMSAPTSIISAGESTSVGYTGRSGGRGGGAGGSILISAGVIDVGTDKISTVGGAGTTGWLTTGGNGGKGRIAVYYGSSLTGSISATLYGSYTNELDTSLVEVGGGYFLTNFI